MIQQARFRISITWMLALAAVAMAPDILLAQDVIQSDAASGGAGVAAVVGFVLTGLGMLVSLAAFIWLLVVAFTVHWGWGLACLILNPFGPLAFLITQWAESWKPFAVNVVGVLVTGAGMALIMTAAPTFMQAFLDSETMAEMVATANQEGVSVEREAQVAIDAPGAPDAAQPAPDAELKPSAVARVKLTKDTVKRGDSVALVRHSLGRPTGEIQTGEDTIIMMYGTMTITARKGQVIEISGAPRQ